MGAAARPELREKLTDQLRTIHTLKRGALRMFDPMLAACRRRAGRGEMAEVSDLLGRMHRVFSAHREETAGHVSLLACPSERSAAPGRESASCSGQRVPR